MTRNDIVTFAKALGLLTLVSSVRDERLMKEELTCQFYHLSAAPCGYMPRRDLIATLRVDDQMNIVDYNNALAICMNTLKQYQSWS